MPSLNAPLTADQHASPISIPEALIGSTRLLETELEARGGIVFSGSSSIRKWESLQTDMAPLPVVNRGFGGAIIKQVTHYTGKMIVPLYPKLVVFYCGENDIANDKYPAEMPLNDFKAFTKNLRSRLAEHGCLVHFPETLALALEMVAQIQGDQSPDQRAYFQGKAHVVCRCQ
jgi:hypothetical protein